MQIAGVPAELQRRRLVDRFQLPAFLLAESDNDGPIVFEEKQRPIHELLVAVQADSTLGSAIGGQAKPLATDVGRRHEQQFDPAVMLDVVETTRIGCVVGSPDDAVKP
jgi:hypothetical protein